MARPVSARSLVSLARPESGLTRESDCRRAARLSRRSLTDLKECVRRDEWRQRQMGSRRRRRRPEAKICRAAALARTTRLTRNVSGKLFPAEARPE